MLLALDVGNTNVTIGVFKRKEIIEVFRITTKLPRTSDEFGILISNLLKEKGLDEHEVKAAIIGSVVPNIMHSLTSGLIKYFDVKPIIVGPGIKTGINLGRFNPREVGADRIVDLVAGYELYGGPALVIDYGTATTYDIVTENGVFLAGVIAPGIRTSANVLYILFHQQLHNTDLPAYCRSYYLQGLSLALRSQSLGDVLHLCIIH